MPVVKCVINYVDSDGNDRQKTGYKWSEGGTCFDFIDGSVSSQNLAKKKAEAQGKIIEANKASAKAKDAIKAGPFKRR